MHFKNYFPAKNMNQLLNIQFHSLLLAISHEQIHRIGYEVYTFAHIMLLYFHISNYSAAVAAPCSLSVVLEMCPSFKL